MDFHLHLNTDTVEQIHLSDPISVGPDTPVREVIDTLAAKDTGSLLVCKDGVLRGIFTERDALRLIAEGADFEAPIEEVMTAKPVALKSSDTVGTAINKMASGGYRRLPIVDDDGRPVGVVKVSGILHFLVEHFPAVIYTLPPRPHHTMQHREGA